MKATFGLVMRLWPLGKVLNRMGSWPVLGPLLEPCFGSEGDEAIIIPVGEAVGGTESAILPFPLLSPLVEGASARVILHECLCRRGEKCQAYPQGVGCLFLGVGAAEIEPERGRPVDVEAALAHLQRAVEVGLVPLVVHSAFDAWLLDIPYRRTLAVCFCCDCCCSVRHGLRLGPPAFWDTIVRLPGLEVKVGPGCTGCGLCLEACHVGALSLQGGRAQIDEGGCKGCGRCVALCPDEVITVRVEDEERTLAQLVARIEARTEIGLARSGA
jgi:UDP-glucose 4-epimerase